MPKQTLTTIEAIDKITDNLDSLDGDAIAHLYELVFGGHATGIDGGLEWEEEDDSISSISEGKCTVCGKPFRLDSEDGTANHLIENGDIDTVTDADHQSFHAVDDPTE